MAQASDRRLPNLDRYRPPLQALLPKAPATTACTSGGVPRRAG